MLDAQALQRLGNQLVAGAVEGGVHQLKGVRHLGHGLLVVDLGHDVREELLVGLRPQDLNESRLHGVVIGHGFDVPEDVQLLQPLCDGVGVMGGQLGAVLPVDLVAVVLLGVVAGGDVDARLAVILPHGEAQLRRGPQGLEDADVNAVGGADLCGGPGELHRVVAAVHADGHAPVLPLRPFGADDVGKTLGGPADDVDVHVVEAHVHGAPQSGGAKLQRPVEPAFDLLGVVFDGLQLGLFRLRQGGACQPLLVFLHEIHMRFLLQ